MIATLPESHAAAYGFKVTGTLTPEDIADLASKIAIVITSQAGKPIGLLADLTEMEGATWSARWQEMHFLRQHSDFIARMAFISDIDWQQVTEMAVATASGLQAESRYFHSGEILHAWHWIKNGPPDDTVPIRLMYPGTGLFADYTSEYVGI